MRIFTLLAATSLTAITAMAGVPMRHAPANASLSQIKAFAKTAISKAPEVSDEVIYETPEGEETLLSRSCDGFITLAFEATHSNILGSVVRMVTAEDGTVYLNHIASEYPVATWVKATREGNTLIISGVQAIYSDYDWETEEEVAIYVVPMEVVIDENQRGTFVATDDLEYRFNIGEDGSLTAADPNLLLGVCVHSADPEATGKDEWVWAGFGDRDIKMTPVTDTVITPPDGMETAEWVFSDSYGSSSATVGFSGDEVYVKGMATTMPEAWVKGIVSGDKVTFPSGQYLGVDNEIYYLSYFCGAEFTTETDEEGEEVLKASLADASVFSYDGEKNAMTSDNGFVINSTADRLFPLYAYDEVTVALQQRNPDAAPAAPYNLVYSADDWNTSIWFQVPNTDVDGNLLHTDRLYYEVIIDGAVKVFDLFDEATKEYNTTTLVPYAYTDWTDFWVDRADHIVNLYDEVKESVAVRSVYVDEDGRELRSEEAIEYMAGIDGVATGGEVASERWYDFTGRATARPESGIAIRVVTLTDGTVKAYKTILR